MIKLVLLASIVLAAAAGLLLLIRGLRGRIVGDHPHCARCGYDLFGNPAAIRCSECGAMLEAPGSIRTGQRRRSGRMIAGGVALILLAILPVAVLAYLAATGFNWNLIKPAGGRAGVSACGQSLTAQFA